MKKKKRTPLLETAFGRWLVAAGQSEHSEEVLCPSCQEGLVRTQYVGDLVARIGYLTAWCPLCLRGIHGCRVRIPDDAPDVLPFGLPSEEFSREIRKRLPEKINYIRPK